MLKDKVALVTGSGSGIGAGIALALCEAGAKVAVADIDQEAAENTVKALKERGFEAAPVYINVTDSGSIERAFDFAVAQYGKLDALINNAGIAYVEGALNIGKEHWNRTFDVNVYGLFLCCQKFALHKKAAGQGSAIVNIASNAAKVCFDGYAHYNASKAAVVNLTQSLSKEFVPFGINVNAVCPGAVDTAMLKDGMEHSIEAAPEGQKPTLEHLRVAWAPVQLKRLIQPVEVGRVVAFLASDAAIIIRGQSISIDGGSTPY